MFLWFWKYIILSERTYWWIYWHILEGSISKFWCWHCHDGLGYVVTTTHYKLRHTYNAHLLVENQLCYLASTLCSSWKHFAVPSLWTQVPKDIQVVCFKIIFYKDAKNKKCSRNNTQENKPNQTKNKKQCLFRIGCYPTRHF